VVFISSSLFCGSVGCVVHLALFEFPHYPQNGHKGQDFLSAGAVSSISPAILFLATSFLCVISICPSSFRK
jgi:hypothetical protein